MRVKQNMFGEFNEAAQPKTPLAKYSIEFDDLDVQTRPHRIAYLRLLGKPYTSLYMRRSVGRLGNGKRSRSFYFFLTKAPRNQEDLGKH